MAGEMRARCLPVRGQSGRVKAVYPLVTRDFHDYDVSAAPGALSTCWARLSRTLITSAESAAAAAPQVVFCLTCSQLLEITTEPSPTAEVTRFTDAARAAPAARMLA
jgi:hypothetical protein